MLFFAIKNEKKKCPVCSSQKVHKKGKRDGKQRYRCSDCYHNFINQNEGVKHNNQFVWFRKWIMERQVYKYLVRDSGMSQSSIQRLFHFYLKSPPQNLIKSKDKVHLIIDGTYFSNGLCLVLYYDYEIQYVQLFRETNQEKFKEIKEDLINLKKLGVDVYSVTCDGHKAILKAVTKVFPNAVIQRCLVHVKRQVKHYLSAFPKLDQAKGLLYISYQITQLKTIEEAHYWLVNFQRWYEQNKNFINQTSFNEESKRWWYTHKNLHQACSHLLRCYTTFICLSERSCNTLYKQSTGRLLYTPKRKTNASPGIKIRKQKEFY